MKLTLIEQEINALTLASADAKALLWAVSRKIAQSLSAEVCLLIPVDNLPSASWSAVDEVNPTKLITGEEKCKELLLEALAASGKDKETPSQALAAWGENLGLSDWEVFPIAQNQLQGWLILGSTQNLALNHHLETPLATALSLALKTAQLHYELEKKERHKLLKQKVTEAIHHSQELESTLQKAIAQTVQSLGITRGMVLTLRYGEPVFGNRQEMSNPNIEVHLLTQWAQTAVLDTTVNSFLLGKSPLCLKAWQQAPVSLSHQQMNESNPSDFLEDSDSMSAWLMTPLMGTSHGDPESQLVLGFLLLENNEPRVWEIEEQELVNWVSTQASTAIIHNKTLQRIQSLVDERTAQLQRSLDVQARLYETSRNQVEQLQELNQLKDEFLATMSHELNTPLATMKMAIRMLHNQKLSPEHQQKYLGILEQEWSREHNLIQDLLTLQKIDKQGIPLQVTAIDLKTLLKQLADEFKSKWEEKKLDLTLTFNPVKRSAETLTIYSDRHSLQRIFLELLSNAGKYSYANTTVEILVSESTHNSITVSVKNVGYTISPAEQTYIFDRFRRGEGVTQKAIPGTGIGLALVKSFVQHIHGTIDLDSECNPEGVGETTFHITLPRSLKDISTKE